VTPPTPDARAILVTQDRAGVGKVREHFYLGISTLPMM
jgi:hypothetical protein